MRNLGKVKGSSLSPICKEEANFGALEQALEEQRLHTDTDLPELLSCFMYIHKIHWLLPAYVFPPLYCS